MIISHNYVVLAILRFLSIFVNTDIKCTKEKEEEKICLIGRMFSSIMEKDLKFPTFECAISNTIENYDSDVEMYFMNSNLLFAKLAELALSDRDFSENYRKMMNYVSDLADSVISGKAAPTHQFLIDLCMGPEEEQDMGKLIEKSKSADVIRIFEAMQYVRFVMFWFVRMSGVERFSKGFSVDRFQGLPFLRLALAYRAEKVSRA